MANKRNHKLRTIRDIHKLLARLVNQRLRQEVESDVVRDAGYLLKIMIDGIRGIELEERLDNLEKAIEKGESHERQN